MRWRRDNKEDIMVTLHISRKGWLILIQHYLQVDWKDALCIYHKNSHMNAWELMAHIAHLEQN